MDKHNAAIVIADGTVESQLELRLRELRDAAPLDAFDKLGRLHEELDLCVEGKKAPLFGTILAWTERERATARWISLQHHRLARSARHAAEALASEVGNNSPKVAQVVALALHHFAETVKCEMSAGPREPRHYAALHALMGLAMWGGRHADKIVLPVHGRDQACTIGALYFRALLLARFASGVLTPPQIEILDEWLWKWMPALRPSGTAESTALRADLDSNCGLRRGKRRDDGPALYLPLAPLERGYAAIRRQLQEGEIVPAEGLASRFRIEEHVAVLGLLRRGFRELRLEPIARAPRRASGTGAELRLGLAEINSMALAAPPPPTVPAGLQVVAASQSDRGRQRAEACAIDELYAPTLRTVHVVDTSSTGLGLEGTLAQCGEIAVGDLVALRLSPDAALELGKVVRRAPAADDSRIVFGVQRIPGATQRLPVRHAGRKAAMREEPMTYVAGEDHHGSEDAFLVTDATLAERGLLEMDAGDHAYVVRLARVRERGRGWVLAGFEIVASRKRAAMQAAA